MNRVKSAVVILFCLILLILFSGWLVHSTNQKLLAHLDNIESLCLMGRFSEAEEQIRILRRYYQKQEHLLALFIRRDYLGSTAVSISGLSAYAASENLRDLCSEIGKARAQIAMVEHLFFSML